MEEYDVGYLQHGSWLSAMPSTRNGFKVLNKVSATSVYNLGIAASQLRERDPSTYRSEKSEVLTYDWKRLIKRRRRISALLSFVSFSKLVILVNTGQPVENNIAYARYRKVGSSLNAKGSSPRSPIWLRGPSSIFRMEIVNG
jgi:hypothetical protein